MIRNLKEDKLSLSIINGIIYFFDNIDIYLCKIHYSLVIKRNKRFRNEKKAGLKELGPRFTLKLRSLQAGTFDSKYGEYEWEYRRKEMDGNSRKKFHL